MSDAQPNRSRITLDSFVDPPSTSLAPEFQKVITANLGDPDFLELRAITLRVAVARGDRGFTVEDVREAAGGLGHYRKNLPGIVCGSLRSGKKLRVIGRVKSTHRAGKGRWINIFMLNPDSIHIEDEEEPSA
jgi:hypothetical protein